MPSNERERELEQYGAAIGIALSNGLHEEGLELAFSRGGGILIPENLPGSSLPARALLDANAVGGVDATLAFSHGEGNQLSDVSISSYGKQGAVKLYESDDRLKRVDVDKDGDGRLDMNLHYERANGVIQSIRVDEDLDGKVDLVLLPVSAQGGNDSMLSGFNVDVGADGSIDGFAEFIRSQEDEVKSIRFRARTAI